MGKTTCILSLCAILGFSACSAKRKVTASEQFAEATKSLRETAYDTAIKQFEELLDQHPFDENAEEAELAIARAYYLEEKCPEAVTALTDFQRRHPTSPQLAMVGYLLGECYEQQMRPPDRDQSASQNAHAYYLALIQQHPRSPFAELAREQMHMCRESLAAHELLVADFYGRRKNVKAKEFRLLDLINRFGDTSAAERGLAHLGELYEGDGKPERAALAYGALLRHHPRSRLAKEARERLREAGKEPNDSGRDPLVTLRAVTGRSRTLALTDVLEVPPLEAGAAQPGFGPGFNPSDTSGPFGGSNPGTTRY